LWFCDRQIVAVFWGWSLLWLLVMGVVVWRLNLQHFSVEGKWDLPLVQEYH
jgi:hypothetical protein